MWLMTLTATDDDGDYVHNTEDDDAGDDRH